MNEFEKVLRDYRVWRNSIEVPEELFIRLNDLAKHCNTIEHPDEYEQLSREYNYGEMNEFGLAAAFAEMIERAMNE